MKTALALLLLNAAWLVLGAFSMASLGEIILQLPPEMLPQWYLGLMTVAMVGAAIWLTAAAYQRLHESPEPSTDASRALVIADLFGASAGAIDHAAAEEPPEPLDDHAAARSEIDSPGPRVSLLSRDPGPRAQPADWVEHDLGGLAGIGDRRFD